MNKYGNIFFSLTPTTTNENQNVWKKIHKVFKVSIYLDILKKESNFCFKNFKINQKTKKKKNKERKKKICKQIHKVCNV